MENDKVYIRYKYISSDHGYKYAIADIEFKPAGAQEFEQYRIPRMK